MLRRMDLFQYLWGLKCRVSKGNMLIETMFVYILAKVYRILLKFVGQLDPNIRSLVFFRFIVFSTVRKFSNEVIK